MGTWFGLRLYRSRTDFLTTFKKWLWIGSGSLIAVVLEQGAMDPITTTAAAGLRARLETLDLVANNLANVSSVGFKAQREVYSTFQANEACSEDCGAPYRSPLLESSWTDLGQGALNRTGNPLDLALSGEGFFVVEGPHGPLLTRGGTFAVGKDGRILTPEGYELQANGRQGIRVNSLFPVTIDSSGILSQQQIPLGQLRVVQPPAGANMSRREGIYFALDTRDLPMLRPSEAVVNQGSLEASNFNPSEAAVKLVGVLRQFETLQKAIQLGGEMNRRASEEVARVQP